MKFRRRKNLFFSSLGTYLQKINKRHYVPRTLPRGNENLCSQKYMYWNVHDGIIHDSLKLDTAQISNNWLMYKQTPCK